MKTTIIDSKYLAILEKLALMQVTIQIHMEEALPEEQKKPRYILELNNLKAYIEGRPNGPKS